MKTLMNTIKSTTYLPYSVIEQLEVNYNEIICEEKQNENGFTTELTYKCYMERRNLND